MTAPITHRRPGRRVVLAVLARLWVAVSLAVPAVALAAGELLDGKRAFPLQAEFDGRAVVVRYNVADGYYLYRSKLRFALDTPGVRLGKPVLPRGAVTDDEFFGRVEIYRGEVEIRLPIAKGAPAPESVVLKATSQGCADAGVCYPPREDRVTLVKGAGPVSTLPADRRKSLLDDLQGKP
jgi:thiol:disulfide interchange protein DsbD